MKKNVLAASIAAAVGFSGLIAAGAPAQADLPPEEADRGPVTVGAEWLTTQVPASGLFHIYSDFGGTVYESDDVGLTIDGVRAFRAVGGHEAEVAAMTTAVTGQMPGYYSSFGTTYANSTAKAASFLLEQGVEGTATTDAVAALKATVSDAAPIAGRIEDQNGFEGADYGSPLGQAFAVQALADAGAPELTSAKAFLLAQQCDAGYFREGFASDKTATDQTCDGAATGEDAASVDTTAFTILALQDLAATDPTVATALDEAATWLAGVQLADGSFAGNANSTGLAGWALGAEGDNGSAADAALWLRTHQLANAGSCTPFAAADDGALVVDDLGVANARSGAMDNLDRSVALRATAQALPALAWAPGGPLGEGQVLAAGPRDYSRAGTTVRLPVEGAPGNTLCVRVGSAAPRAVLVGAAGTALIPVPLPARTATTKVSVVDIVGRTGSASFIGLGAKTLRPQLATTTVRSGKKTLVSARGLASGETVKVLLRGKVVLRSSATGQGTLAKRITVTGKPGRAKVVLVGEFTDRRGSTTVTVVR